MTNAEIKEYAKKNMCPVCSHKPDCDITACARRDALFDAVDVAKNVKKMLIEEASEWLKAHAAEYAGFDYITEDCTMAGNFIDDFKTALE